MLSPKINNIAKMGDNKPKVMRLTSVLKILFYIINDLKKIAAWREKVVTSAPKFPNLIPATGPC